MANPREYYNDHLLPAYQEWQERPHEDWLAKAAAGNANNLAERFAIFLKIKPAEYRRKLRDECPEFGWIWDIAEGSKHYILDRQDARVSRADQVIKSSLIDDWPDFDAALSVDDHAVFIVNDNNGNKRYLDELMSIVMAMFERLLKEHRL